MRIFDLHPLWCLYWFYKLNWKLDDKQLIKEIFRILEENNAIQKSIWPLKTQNSKTKSKISHFETLAKELLQDEPKIKDFLKIERTVKHYCINIKNQVSRCKKIKIKIMTSTVTKAEIFHKDTINKESHIMNKWQEVLIHLLYFYLINNLMDNWFDNIKTTITNSRKEVDLVQE